MKLISFEHVGHAGFGAVVDGGVVDLGTALNGQYADLQALLAALRADAAAHAEAGRPRR